MYSFLIFFYLFFFFRCAKLNCKLKHVKNWFSYKRKCCLRNGKPLPKIVVKKESPLDLNQHEIKINKVFPPTPKNLCNMPKLSNFNCPNFCSNNGFLGQNPNFNPIRQLNNYRTVNYAPLVVLNLNEYFRVMNLVWTISNLV